VPADPHLARYWLEKAAAKGDAEAKAALRKLDAK
jgi:TPR repeat protein